MLMKKIAGYKKISSNCRLGMKYLLNSRTVKGQFDSFIIVLFTCYFVGFDAHLPNPSLFQLIATMPVADAAMITAANEPNSGITDVPMTSIVVALFV